MNQWTCPTALQVIRSLCSSYMSVLVYLLIRICICLYIIHICVLRFEIKSILEKNYKSQILKFQMQGAILLLFEGSFSPFYSGFIFSPIVSQRTIKIKLESACAAMPQLPSEAHLWSCQTSKMGLFAKNKYQLLALKRLITRCKTRSYIHSLPIAYFEITYRFFLCILCLFLRRN